MKRFIDIHVPVTNCNLNCHYCYVPQQNYRDTKATPFQYTPETIGKALNAERLGGICHFNMCGLGETLIPEYIVKVTEEILKQGHYIMIVTNGTLTKRFEEFCKLSPDLLKRLGFKFSFHYLELMRTNQLNVFFNNVDRIRKAGCSFSVELTPNDEIVPYIPEIKRISIERTGALCHVTVPRDMRTEGIDLLTNQTREEFVKTWQQFNSELFDFKMSTWGIKREEFCYAGCWSGLLNIGNGEFAACYSSYDSGAIQNIFKNIKKPIKFLPIGHGCKKPHCFNSHSFLTMGDIPDINTYNYAQVRNRVCVDGSEWLNQEMKTFLSGRLEDENNILNPLKEKFSAAEAFAFTLEAKIKRKLRNIR